MTSRLLEEAAVAEPAALITVDIRADVTDALLRRIEALGGTVVNSHPKYRAIRARAPTKALEALAAEKGVQFIRRAEPSITHGGLAALPEMLPTPNSTAADQVVTTAGDAIRFARPDTSEGVAAHDVHTARDHRYGVDGAGIGIGVLSDSIDTLTARQESGDLPPQVSVLPGQAGGGDEGTAMLEIVHDLALGADLLASSRP